MTATDHSPSRASVDRVDLLSAAWDAAALEILATVGLRTYRAGSLDATDDTALLVGGVLLLAFALRDHLLRGQRETRDHADNPLWLAVTAGVFAVSTAALLAALAPLL